MRKLISISGSLKDTVGVLNPYRYRGYRYDTETGFYYLQSRYYNPEWGRFINTDSIVGQTGELLGHNMFSYCKNNAVNMSDSNENRPEFSGTGHDTGEDLEVSLAIMNHRYDYNTGTIRRPGSKSTSSGRIVPSRSQVKGVTKSAIVTGIEGGISSTLKDIPKAVPLATNRALRRAGLEFMVPVKGANALRGIGSVERVGAVGVVFTGVAVWDNFHSGYSSSEAWGRTGIDVGVSAAVIGIGLVTPVGLTVLAAAGLGLGAEVIKNRIWEK